MRRANAKNLHQHAAPLVMLGAAGILLSAVFLVSVTRSTSTAPFDISGALTRPVVRVHAKANGLASVELNRIKPSAAQTVPNLSVAGNRVLSTVRADSNPVLPEHTAMNELNDLRQDFCQPATPLTAWCSQELRQ